MNPATCAWCPRLCRHVCPIAVATGQESATPTAIMTMILLAEKGQVSMEDTITATEACLDCGACTHHCHNHIPVADTILSWRHQHGIPQPPLPLFPPIEGDPPTIAILLIQANGTCHDWRNQWPQPLACAKTPDLLGYTYWRHANHTDKKAYQEHLKAHFAGRNLLTSSPDIATLTQSANIPTQLLPAPEAISCGVNCCGRRDDFPLRRPQDAHTLAQRLIQRHPSPLIFADQACAHWINQNHGQALGPEDLLNPPPHE